MAQITFWFYPGFGVKQVTPVRTIGFEKSRKPYSWNQEYNAAKIKYP